MLSRLGSRADVAIEVISKPREEYRLAEYSGLGLPLAPAIMVGEEVIVTGKDIDEATVEAAIRRHLEQSGREG
ncbi:MAG: hypothetical protein HGA96_11605 [Desulfobulbaceae bacterium]|nr:hypothetical protein [Desulfobulbaceae bacterium]